MKHNSERYSTRIISSDKQKKDIYLHLLHEGNSEYRVDIQWVSVVGDVGDFFC